MLEKLMTILFRRPFLGSFFLGCIGGASFAPFQFFLLLAVSFTGFLVLFEKMPTRLQALLQGYCFGFGFFLVSTYWVGISFTCVGLSFLAPFIMLAFAALLAIFPAIATLASFSKESSRLLLAIRFTLCWSITEYARGTLFTGFPWNLTGNVWGLPLLQTSAWWGIYALSLLTTWAASVVFTKHKRLIVGTAAFITLLWGYGFIKTTFYPFKEETSIVLRLVQPSIAQDQKWDPSRLRNNFERQFLLSSLDSERPVNLLIWPEAALPFSPFDENLKKQFKKLIPKNAHLITGGIRIDENKERRFFNSCFVINADGRVVDSYDKAHLVPFGEYVPLKSVLPINKLTDGFTDYTPGQGPKTLSLKDVPSVACLICYEIIFPNKGLPLERPAWVLNLTNDAWYGNSSGPYQHLAIAQLRAIEYGVPVVRVANNGISAIIRADGSLAASLKLNDVGIIDGYLPAALPPTLFHHYGHLFYVISLLMGAGGYYIVRRRNHLNSGV